MEILTVIFLKIIPLYFFIAIGYIISKRKLIEVESVNNLLFYIILPFVIFNSLIFAKLSSELIFIPILVFIICCLISGLGYLLGKKLWSDSRINILAFNSGSANFGYFGIPLAFSLLDSQNHIYYLMAYLGMSFFQVGVGLLIAAGGKLKIKDNIKTFLTYPFLYAFILGLLINLIFNPASGSGVYQDIAAPISGSFTFLGMAIVGMGVGSNTKIKIDWLYSFVTIMMKNLIWPVLITVFIIIDQNLLQLFTNETYKSLIILSLVPVSATSVIYAFKFSDYGRETSFTVLLSTLSSLIIVPLGYIIMLAVVSLS